ncbi:MAG TPA: type II secretion system F family protein [Candidatus Saccharimonadales bacterium]|nr:type II secretion system F family protein [Candidatus Saccharimonadales bacterium]
MRFDYKALNKEGKTITGNMEAATKEALVATLAKQGIHPLSVKVGGAKGATGDKLVKKKVKLADLVIFSRQLSTMISAGVPLARSLSALQEDSESPVLQQIIAGVTKDVESGMPLGDAFAKYPKVFSEVYVNMVRAGEDGGILDEILKRLASQVEQDNSIRKKIKSAMMYPTVILTVTIIAFFGIMIFIMPKIDGIMKQLGGPNAQLPSYTRAMLAISHFTQHYILFIIIGMVALAVGFLRYIHTPNGKYKWHGFLLRMPIIKTIVMKIAIARFSRTFASLMAAGVSVLDALDVTGAAIGNKVIEAELKSAAEEVKNGRQLSQPLKESKHFPPIVSQMMQVGEETGQIDQVLVKIADFYEEEVSVLIDGLAAIIEPIMIILLGAGVGLIAASVMGPIANLSKNVGSG